MRDTKTLRCWAEIDLDAIRQNARLAKGCSPGGVMAVVKADAYGHGIIPVATTLNGSVDYFGVATLDEALTLRSNGVTKKVFILSPALPCERSEIVDRGFVPAVSSAMEARAFGEAAPGRDVEISFIVDTGMGRVGAVAESGVSELVDIAKIHNIKVTSIASHLPSADDDEDYTREQIDRFFELAGEELPGGFLHIANSAGMLGYQLPEGTVARAGLMLYGASPLPKHQDRLRPAMTFKSRVSLVRDLPEGSSISYGRTFITERRTKVATVAVGYGDGYPRDLSGQGAEVVISSRRCPVLGRVTMDSIMIDASNLASIGPGDEVTLIGESIPVSEMAEKAGTIPWEIFTGVTARVPRIYSE